MSDTQDKLKQAQERLQRGEPITVYLQRVIETPDGPLTTQYHTKLAVCPYCKSQHLLRDPSGRTVDLATHMLSHVEGET